MSSNFFERKKETIKLFISITLYIYKLFTQICLQINIYGLLPICLSWYKNVRKLKDADVCICFCIFKPKLPYQNVNSPYTFRRGVNKPNRVLGHNDVHIPSVLNFFDQTICKTA